MKILMKITFLALIFSSCEKSPENMTSYFDSLGIELVADFDNLCVDQQMDKLFKQMIKSDKAVEVMDLLKKKEINRIEISALNERAAECDQALIDLGPANEVRVCDPQSYENYRSRKIDMRPTYVSLEDNMLGLEVHSQELTRNLITHKYNGSLGEELVDLERQLTRESGKDKYLSFELISEYRLQHGLVMADVGKILDHRCGELLTIDGLIFRLKL